MTPHKKKRNFLKKWRAKIGQDFLGSLLFLCFFLFQGFLKVPQRGNPLLLFGVFLLKKKNRTIPALITIKSGPPPQKNPKYAPPLKPGILWTCGFSCRKNAEILGAHKIGAAISGPRIADKNFTDTRIFLKDVFRARRLVEQVLRAY